MKSGLTYQDKSYSFYGNPVFRVVRRREFDHWLLRSRSKRAGATVRQGEAVEDVIHKRDYVEVRTEKPLFTPKLSLRPMDQRALCAAA